MCPHQYKILANEGEYKMLTNEGDDEDVMILMM
jgi:hypothetical protein